MDQFTQAVREVAREEVARVSPPIRPWRVVKRTPLLLEDFASDLRLTEGDDDFEVARGIRPHVKVGDVVMVAAIPNGDSLDYLAVGLGTTPGSKESGGEEEEGDGDKNYVHDQGIAAKEWLIEHGLGKEPAVTAFDTAEHHLDFQQVPVSDDTVILRFNIDISGRAVLN